MSELDTAKVSYQVDDGGPDTEHPGLLAMRQRWVLPMLLLGGTESMRAAGEEYLPRGEEENEKDWERRRDATVLYNYFTRAINNMASMPTGEPTTIHEPTPLQDEMTVDVDRMGKNLTKYVRDCLWDMSIFGMAITLTSYPKMPMMLGEDDEEKTLTMAEKRALDIRPYFIRVPPVNLISWDHDNRGNLTYFAYRETTQQRRGVYQIVNVTAIVEWSPHGTRRWELEDKIWTMVEETEHDLGLIPLRVAYAGQEIAPFTADPPLEELAELNGQHWRDRSAQNGVERVTRNPLLVISDVQKADTQKFSVGPYTALAINKPNMQGGESITFVESEGKAAQVGRELLRAIEDRMESLSVEPLTLRHAAPTATQVMVDDSRSVSDLQSWVKALESELGRSFVDAETWEDARMSDMDAPAVNISKDFATLPNSSLIESVERDYEMGAIVLETYLYERKRYGVYSDEFDPVEEAAKAKAAGAEKEDEIDED